MPLTQFPPFDANVPEGVLLGFILLFVAIFGGMRVFTWFSRFRRESQNETVGPHVVEPHQKWYGNTPHTVYRCKFCGKERELKAYFHSEDCEEFDAVE
ncbi:hypothetical protein C477_04109 [Haloterrigena salina JCM 13891]|uniref:Uncharacterized protein n=1 Tax=Haloterrigena salina JCM 13891 TaxID=1227488 RepID=M0CGZ1_9EURY|nr:hypothetical protein [Haloterrigena salina]ELZ22550.1 hypothetical protein C477_04109 [Haloterrigena salina JCM 13891]